MTPQQSLETEIALIHRDMRSMKETMDDLYTEIKELNRAMKDDVTSLDKRIRALEDERIRLRVWLPLIIIIINTILSVGAQQLFANQAKEVQSVTSSK